MAKEKVDYMPYIYIAGGLVVYFGIIRPFTNALGITKSADDIRVQNENVQAGKAVGWNPNLFKGVTNTTLYTDATITNFAKLIHNAWGIFNDDEETIYGVFRQLKNQMQLSQLSSKYFDMYQEDLYSRLTAPWYKGNDGLEPDEFNIIAKMVNALPYK